MSEKDSSDLRALFQGGDAPSLDTVVSETRTRMSDLSKERAEIAERLRTGKVRPQDSKPLVDLAGVVGGFCLLAGLGSMAFTTGVNVASLLLTGLGVVLGGIYLALEWSKVKATLSMRSTVYGANLGMTLGVLLAILVVINLLANRYYSMVDLTSSQLNSLSPQSLQLLKKLADSGRDISITAFYPKDSAHKEDIRRIERIFSLYTHEDPHLKFQMVDPDVNLKLAQEKGYDTPGLILFESGDTKARTLDYREPALTGALLKVTNPTSKIVYFITGHNEYRVTDDGDNGLSKLSEKLGTENITVKELSIPKEDGVPADAAAVILVRPAVTPLLTQELGALKEYLDRGGNLMILLEPLQGPEVAAWLEGYGLNIRQDKVVDVASNYYKEPTDPLLYPVENEQPHPLTPPAHQRLSGEEGIPDQVETPSASSLEIKNQSIWTPLFASSPDVSFGETDLGGTPEYTEGKDTQGPLVVIAAGQKQLSEDATGGRMFVAGDANWLTNGHLAHEYNLNLAVNAVDWLVGSDEQIAIRPKEINNDKANLTVAGGNMVVGAVFGIPLIVAFAGVAVWWRRRSW